MLHKKRVIYEYSFIDYIYINIFLSIYAIYTTNYYICININSRLYDSLSNNDMTTRKNLGNLGINILYHCINLLLIRHFKAQFSIKF